MEGMGAFLPLILIFGVFYILLLTVCFSTTGDPKKVDQKIRTIVESKTASITFLDSIYFPPFFDFGTGSNPSPAPRIFIGWHRANLLNPK